MDLFEPTPPPPGRPVAASGPSGPPDEPRLIALLRERFGHTEFRPHQREACLAAAAGEDLLLVMPTGAGKSLCYQLPGLARGGATLVISPLIALMEDQVAKLCRLGLRAERIHSGRERGQSREVCAHYLEGRLDYLFIAPERLSVPGFPEMLARHKPCLIAVDEAHCISQWGHDFRPDYRLLCDRLPALRPAPILALTATATPLVQRDISDQLGMPEAGRHIHGFRRSNIAVEVVELRPGARGDTVVRLLEKPPARPAIVYAPTRKQTEAVAERLADHFPAAAYHAGMAAGRRDQVQEAFLDGNLEVIVATIAFGMGIDKPDVRTVIHTAMPATVEGYYQEIGRAGRDGAPARAVLLQSFVDRKQHEHFLERDYPEPGSLQRVYQVLGDEPQSRDWIEDQLLIRGEALDRALDMLKVHRGAVVDFGGDVRRGVPEWQRSYDAQRGRRSTQLAEITRFADNRTCRMLQLVRHFGDQEDHGEPCGICDVCDPGGAVALEFREPSPDERDQMLQILEALRQRDGQTSGQLHRELFGRALDRNGHERLVGALVRAGLVNEAPDSFEKDGRVIEFKRVRLTAEGAAAREVAGARMAVEPETAPTRSAAGPRASRRRSTRPRPADLTLDLDDASVEASPELVESLKRWRRETARVQSVPPYVVLHDRTLVAIAAHRPQDARALLAIKGMGPTRVERHGEAILALIRGEDPAVTGR